MVTVGSILGGTWRFVNANWRVIAIWSAVSLVLSIAMRLALGPIYEAQLAAVATPGMNRGFSVPLVLLIGLIALVLVLVQYNAVFRAVLFPADDRAAYLRLGVDELRLFGLMLIVGVASVAATMLFGVVIMVVGAFLRIMVSGAGAGAGLSAIGIILLVEIAIWCALVFVAVRLSPAAPLTLYHRQIVIGPAWRLTRGRFWRLFGAYALLFLAALVIGAAYSWPVLQASMAAAGRPGDPEAARLVAEAQAAQMRLDVSLPSLLRLLVTAAFSGLMVAVFGGMPAVATAQLLDEKLRRPFEGEDHGQA